MYSTKMTFSRGTMTKILTKCNFDTDSEEYIKTVNSIHQQFDKLASTLDLYSIKNSMIYLKDSYKSFSKEVEQDLKYKG